MKLRPMEVFLKSGKNNAFENCLICLAISLLATFFYYEYSFESRIRIHSAMTWLIAVSLVILWIKCAVLSGRDKKFGFAIFAFLYWGLPYVYMLIYAGRDNVRGYNKWLAMTNRIAKALNLYPFADQAKSMGISPQIIAVVLLFLIMAAFGTGFFIKYRYDLTHAPGHVKEYDGDYIMDDENETDDNDDSPDSETSPDASEDHADPVNENGAVHKTNADVADLKDFLNR